MVAINFQRQFVEPIRLGLKTQTIRKTNKAKSGDVLQLYTGMRTKDCEKIMDAICRISTYCAVRDDGLTLGIASQFPRDIDEFAQADGFKNYEEMRAWFRSKYGPGEFVGRVIAWRLPA